MAKNKAKLNKFLTGAVTATMVAAAVVPVAAAATPTFSDVKNADDVAAVTLAVENGFFQGNADGTFKPYSNITRGQVAKTLARHVAKEAGQTVAEYVAANDLKAAVTPFTDVPATHSDPELYEASLVVKHAGVFTGSNNNLAGAKAINRAQMASVLVRAFGLQDLPGDLSKVTDSDKVDGSHKANIHILSENGVTTESAFRPFETVKRVQMAKFLNRALEVSGNQVAVGVESVKAVNATTVEVTFKNKVENIGTFSIEGLAVSNAAVKQSNDKVVVITTAVQTGGTKYAVKLDGNAVGSFEGISAVIPTKIDFVGHSTQGKVGQQVVLTADVGVKQAGIAVTFNVDALGTSLNKDQVFESLTNADGIATFSYTQYAAGNDHVVAYPTGAPSVRTDGYVFWGVDISLSVEEVDKGNTVNNGANKTYKVTYVSPTTGKPVANKRLVVSFEENINVNVNQLSNAKVNNVNPAQLLNGTAPTAPVIITNAKGEATFTVTGENTAVTPIVFEQQVYSNTVSNTNYTLEYAEAALQVVAPKVTFGAVQAEYVIELKRDGSSEAAVGVENGREYNILVKDKDGKVAKNETVNVAFDEDLDGVIATHTEAKFIKEDANDNPYFAGDQITVVTNAKGEASFVIGSTKVNDYGTPIAWIDVNSANAKEGKLDQGEPSAKGEISYFAESKLAGASLTTYNAAGKKSKDIDAGEPATFKVSLTNQSGTAVTLGSVGYNDIRASFTVYNTGANDVIVEGQTISPNRSYTVSATKKADGTYNDSIEVTSVNGKTTSVKVLANGVAYSNSNSLIDFNFTSSEATAKFTASTDVADLYTGDVVSFNKKDKTITFAGKKAIAYAGKSGYTYKYFGGNGAQLAIADDFIEELATAKGSVRVTYKVDADSAVTFSIVRLDATGTAPKDENAGSEAAAEAAKAVTKAITDLPAVEELALTDKAAVNKARADYDALAKDAKDLVTQATVDVLKAAEAKIAELEAATPAEAIEITSVTGEAANPLALEFLGAVEYKVAGTVADATVTEVKITFSGVDADETVTAEVKDGVFNWSIGAGELFGNFNKVTATYGDKSVSKDFVVKVN